MADAYEAIESVGYEPAREDEADGDEESPADRELRKQRRLVAGGAVLTAPFVYLMATMVTPLSSPESLFGGPPERDAEQRLRAG